MRSFQSLAILTTGLMAVAIVKGTCGRVFGPDQVLAAGPELTAPRVIRVYSPDTSDFANPERGFYKGFAPFFLETERTPLRDAGLSALRPQGMTIGNIRRGR